MFYTLKLRYFSDFSWKGKLLSVMAVSVTVLMLVILSSYNGLLPRVLGEKMPEIKIDPLGMPAVGVANATKLYGIMFDAGSTGSRIHVYTFFRKKDGNLDLEGEVFEQIKPGLSSYADNPKKGAESLKELLDIAKKKIPEPKWKGTPVALKATAGLRLLPQAKSDALLIEVTSFLKSYPFHLIDNGVAIMDGTEEGLFSWVTLNFLLGQVNDIENTSGMMDLGGGSTQITFYPKFEETKNSMKDDFKVFYQDKKGKLALYTHSYLGLGLMSARKGIFGGGKDDKTLSSPCLPVNYKGKWRHQSKDYEVSGSSIASDTRFKTCYELAKKVVGSSVHKEKEVNKVPFYVFSYYYDTASDAKLIDFGQGGTLRVDQFMEAADKECASPVDKEPFLCMDLTYLSALLHEGFGFNKDTMLHLKKKIKGVETAWCLGAMFSVMNKLDGKS